MSARTPFPTPASPWARRDVVAFIGASALVILLLVLGGNVAS
jgi:hypothetical protein